MIRKRYWLPILLILLVLGCSLPSLRRTTTSESISSPTVTRTATVAPTSTPLPEATATRTATVAPTVTPTATPKAEAPRTTRAPTQTSTPAFKAYDLTGVRISAEDLPPGFMPFDISTFGMDVSEFGDGQYDIENFDFYLSMFPPEFVFTFLIQAKSEAEQAEVDAILENPEAMLDQLAFQIGELREQKVLTDVPEVGDKSSGVTVLMTMAGQEYQVEMIVFRRASVVGFAGDMHAPNRDPRASVGDIALLLDERLEVAIDGQ